MMNLSDIGKHIALYRAGHNDQFPENLEVLVKTTNMDPQLLKNPRRDDLKIGFKYIKPYEGGKDGSRILAYEDYKEWGEGIGCLRVDLSVVTIRSEKAFQRMLKEATVPATTKSRP